MISLSFAVCSVPLEPLLQLVLFRMLLLVSLFLLSVLSPCLLLCRPFCFISYCLISLLFCRLFVTMHLLFCRMFCFISCCLFCLRVFSSAACSVSYHAACSVSVSSLMPPVLFISCCLFCLRVFSSAACSVSFPAVYSLYVSSLLPPVLFHIL
jgi:hypothetical protein